MSIKDAAEDPWLTADTRYGPGQVVSGKVVSHTTFGLFVEIEPGLEGLVHKSDLVTSSESWATTHPEGRGLQVKIQSIDPGLKKMVLAQVAPVATDKEAVDRETSDTPHTSQPDNDPDMVLPSSWQAPTSLVVGIVLIAAVLWFSRMLH